MITLTEEHYQLIQQYLALVRTVNEAFTYVVTSFDNLTYTEGDVVLSDIFTAIQQLSGTNTKLTTVFDNFVPVKESLKQFSQIVQQVNELESLWENTEARQQLIQEKLSPTYASWSDSVLQALQPYAVS